MPAQTSGQPKVEESSNIPVPSGERAEKRLRGTLVTPAAAPRSSGGTTAITYDWRAGTSIEETDARRRRNRIASCTFGISAARISNPLDGRCVNTIVLIRPKRAASRAETNCENDPSRPTTKKNVPAAATDMLKRLKSQSASSDCTTNPPPNASRLNSIDSRMTTLRDLASGLKSAGGGSDSTPVDNVK